MYLKKNEFHSHNVSIKISLSSIAETKELLFVEYSVSSMYDIEVHEINWGC